MKPIPVLKINFRLKIVLEKYTMSKEKWVNGGFISIVLTLKHKKARLNSNVYIKVTYQKYRKYIPINFEAIGQKFFNRAPTLQTIGLFLTPESFNRSMQNCDLFLLFKTARQLWNSKKNNFFLFWAMLVLWYRQASWLPIHWSKWLNLWNNDAEWCNNVMEQRQNWDNNIEQCWGKKSSYWECIENTEKKIT